MTRIVEENNLISTPPYYPHTINSLRRSKNNIIVQISHFVLGYLSIDLVNLLNKGFIFFEMKSSILLGVSERGFTAPPPPSSYSQTTPFQYLADSIKLPERNSISLSLITMFTSRFSMPQFCLIFPDQSTRMNSILKLALQVNLWVNSGSGKFPSV